MGSDVCAPAAAAPSPGAKQADAGAKQTAAGAAAALTADARAAAPPAPPAPATAWPAGRRAVGVGLRNLGNSCFMNATLQALTHCPPLAAAAAANSDASLLSAHVNAALDVSAPTPLSPAAIFAALPRLNKALTPGRQEDAHEFLRAVLAPPSERALEALFRGTLRSRVICSSCSTPFDTDDPFLDIALNVPQFGGGGASVAASLAAFCAPETLSGADAFKCGACSTTCPARKKFSIQTPPPVLCLVLKRFAGVGGTKLGCHVAFTQSLDLPVAAGPAARYGLAAVVVHAGATARSGHYFAYVRGARGAWWRADDDHVEPAPWSDVAAAAAYMLFYVKDGVCAVEPGAEPSPAAHQPPAPATASPFASVSLASALAAPAPPASPWRAAAGRPGLAPFATAEAAGPSPSPTGRAPPPRHPRLTPPPPPPRVFTSASAARRAAGGYRSRGAMLVAAATGSAASTPGSTPGSVRRARGADDLAGSVEKRLRPGSG